MGIPKIDSKVTGWVNVINSYPDLQTVGSCGGQTRPEDYPCLPENEFFVMFKFKTDYPSKKSWQSFRNLVQSITECDWDDGNTKDAWVRIEVTMTVFSELFFRIHGHNVLPKRAWWGLC
jgi:hypothetical protein